MGLVAAVVVAVAGVVVAAVVPVAVWPDGPCSFGRMAMDIVVGPIMPLLPQVREGIAASEP